MVIHKTPTDFIYMLGLNTLMQTKRYKIGCVTSSISYYGGWDTLSKGIIGAISKKHDVVVLTSRDAKNDMVSYPIHRVLPEVYITYSIWNQILVFFFCLKHFPNCDAIHTFVEPFTPGAALAAKILRKPLFITIAATYAIIPKGNTLRQILKRIMMKFMYRQAVFIATGSYQNIELIEEVMSLGGKWKFVPFGVDPEKYKATQAYTPSPYPFLFTVGAIKPRKGSLYTIRALALLKDEFPTLRYKIGGMCNEKLPYVQQLRSEITKLGLKDRVEFLGRISDETLLELYGTCTVFVLAAQTIDGSREGFPMVFYEAHSLGAPVISTYGFGSEYVIKNGHNGFLVPQENVTKLAEAIRKIVGNETLRAELSKNAKEEARKHSWDDIGLQYLAAYDRIIPRTQ